MKTGKTPIHIENCFCRSKTQTRFRQHKNIGIDERNNLPKEEYEDKVFIDFVQFAIEYAKQHKEKKFIVEGIWLYLYFDDPSLFADYAVFIKGTSFLKSKIRATKREMHRDKEALQDRKQMFGREVRNYLLDEDKIDRYRDFYGESPYTIFSDETSEADKKSEANTEFSHWDKLRIINECKLALLDLRI